MTHVSALSITRVGAGPASGNDRATGDVRGGPGLDGITRTGDPADVADLDAVLDVLAPAFGYPDLAARRHRAAQTIDETATVVARVDGAVVAAACVTLDGLPAGHGRLDAIGVEESLRGRGIGRELLRRVVDGLALVRLDAETDPDAVGFYRRLGFEVTSLGEPYPGVERFACVLTTAPVPTADATGAERAGGAA